MLQPKIPASPGQIYSRRFALPTQGEHLLCPRRRQGRRVSMAKQRLACACGRRACSIAERWQGDSSRGVTRSIRCTEQFSGARYLPAPAAVALAASPAAFSTRHLCQFIAESSLHLHVLPIPALQPAGPTTPTSNGSHAAWPTLNGQFPALSDQCRCVRVRACVRLCVCVCARACACVCV